jgi:hypothetical protein
MMNLREQAMNTMETIRKAQEERISLINNCREALVVLGAEEVTPMTETVNNIVINKGKIVEVKTVKEVQVTNEEELNKLYEENARHIRRINELAAENEKLIDETIELENQIAFKDGQIIELQRQIKELEKQAAIQETVEEVVEETVKKQDTPKEEEVVKEEEYDMWIDKLSTLKFYEDFCYNDEAFMHYYNLIDKTLRDKTIEDRVKSRTFRNGVKQLDNRQQELKDIEAIKDKIQYTIVEGPDCSGLTIVKEVEGKIILADKEYNFKATRNHILPTVFGCLNKELIEEAATIITKAVPRFTFCDTETSEDKVYYFDNIVVWDNIRDNTFEGYTAKYQFVWDKVSEVPEGHQFHAKTRKPMNPNRGSIIAKDCALILATCQELMQPKETKEEIIDEDMDLEIDC